MHYRDVSIHIFLALDLVLQHALQAAQCTGDKLVYFNACREALILQVKMECGKLKDEQKLRNNLNK